jgi:hypothetical protein
MMGSSTHPNVTTLLITCPMILSNQRCIVSRKVLNLVGLCVASHMHPVGMRITLEPRIFAHMNIHLQV